jgi:amino acid permease
MLDVLQNVSSHTTVSHPTISYMLGSRGLICLFGALLILPMCFVRSLSSLSYNTIMSVFALACGVVFVIASFSASMSAGQQYEVNDLVAVKSDAWMVIR